MHGEPKYGANSKFLEYVNTNTPQGGEITLSETGGFDSLNMFSIKGDPAAGLHLLHDRLTARVWDEPFSLYPLIAEKIIFADDRSSMRIFIDPDAKFHDGSSITASDVVFSWRTLKEHGRPNMRRIYSIAEKFEKINDLEIYIEFSDDYDMETAMTFAMMPVLQKSWWENREFDSSVSEIPVGSGPYKISEFDIGKKIVYERVKDYWAKNKLTNTGHHNFDKITYKYFRDDMVALEAFKAGEIDFRKETDIGKWKNNYNFSAVENHEVKIEEIEHSRPERVESLIFNTRRKPFDDINIRKAFNLIFDFEWANKNLYFGFYKRINSYFPNSSLAAKGVPSTQESELLKPWAQHLSEDIFNGVPAPVTNKDRSEKRANMIKASKLLEESGWVLKNGKRYKDGKALSFEIITNNSEDEKLILPFIRDLSKLGIDAKLRVLESSSFTKRLMNYDYDMVSYYWNSSLSPGTEQYQYWSCESAKEFARWNYMGVCNPALDHFTQKISSAKDRDELETYAKIIDRILLSGNYIIPLGYTGKDLVAYKSYLHHPEYIPLYGNVFETWWKPEA